MGKPLRGKRGRTRRAAVNAWLISFHMRRRWLVSILAALILAGLLVWTVLDFRGRRARDAAPGVTPSAKPYYTLDIAIAGLLDPFIEPTVEVEPGTGRKRFTYASRGPATAPVRPSPRSASLVVYQSHNPDIVEYIQLGIYLRQDEMRALAGITAAGMTPELQGWRDRIGRMLANAAALYDRAGEVHAWYPRVLADVAAGGEKGLMLGSDALIIIEYRPGNPSLTVVIKREDPPQKGVTGRRAGQGARGRTREAERTVNG
jgi:hypothetical protein